MIKAEDALYGWITTTELDNLIKYLDTETTPSYLRGAFLGATAGANP